VKVNECANIWSFTASGTPVNSSESGKVTSVNDEVSPTRVTYSSIVPSRERRVSSFSSKKRASWSVRSRLEPRGREMLIVTIVRCPPPRPDQSRPVLTCRSKR